MALNLPFFTAKELQMTLRFLGGALLAMLSLSVSPAFTQDAAKISVVADGLDYPWAIAALDDRIFLTEKPGNVWVLEAGRNTRAPLITSAPIETDGGRGLLGMALAPDFGTSGRAYFYHSVVDGNRVIVAQLSGGSWTETAVLLDGIPGHRLYNGGRIAIGPDGMLYVTTGWIEDYSRPQDPENLAGKILRLNPDGSVPADNPIPGSPIWTLGHRNPQGIAWDETGRMFAAEHGQSALDELNVIEKGANYGWPLVQGDEVAPGMTLPFAHSGNSTWAPSGIAIRGEELFMAALGSREIRVFSTKTGKFLRSIGLGERIRAVEVIDDALFAITTNRSPRGSGPSDDRLLKIALE